MVRRKFKPVLNGINFFIENSAFYVKEVLKLLKKIVEKPENRKKSEIDLSSNSSHISENT